VIAAHGANGAGIGDGIARDGLEVFDGLGVNELLWRGSHAAVVVHNLIGHEESSPVDWEWLQPGVSAALERGQSREPRTGGEKTNAVEKSGSAWRPKIGTSRNLARLFICGQQLLNSNGACYGARIVFKDLREEIAVRYVQRRDSRLCCGG